MNIRRGVVQNGEKKLASVPTKRKYGAMPVPVNADGQSHSEAYLQSRNTGTVLSGKGMQSVSEERRSEILTRGTTKTGDKYPVPLLVHGSAHKQNMQKTAAVTTSGTSFGGSGSADVVRQAPEVYSPLFQIANLQLPRERVTMNAWNRNFYDTHPIVHNCINLHATYPIGKLNIKCKHKHVEQFFNDMNEELDLLGILHNIALEYWCLGECFPYATLDPKRGVWKSIEVLNPDYVHVKKSVIGNDVVISLRPDAALQRLITSNNPADIKLRQQIDEEILYHVRKGNAIPLDNFHVSHLKMVTRPYDIRGTSIIVSVYKDLMHWDKLREAKYAQADNLVNPITLVQVGGAAEGEYHPTSGDLEHWRQIMENAQYDKDFKIISHAGIKIERVGASGAVIDIAQDLNFIIDNLLYGLMTPKAILTQEGASYNSASIGLEVLKQRYEAFRNMIARWLKVKIFAPISEIQNFYEFQNGNKKLIVPDVDWNQMILFDMTDYINVLQALTQPGSQGEPPKISRATLFRSLGIDPEEEKRKVRREMIEEQIAIKEKQIVQGMTINRLKAIKEDEDIVEGTEEPLPGQVGMPGVGIPGGDMGLGLGGPPGGGLGGGLGLPSGGLGGPPPMGGELGPPGGLGAPPPAATPAPPTPTAPPPTTPKPGV